MTMTNQPAPQPNDDRSLVTRLDNWVDQRTGIDSILHETLDEPIVLPPLVTVVGRRRI